MGTAVIAVALDMQRHLLAAPLPMAAGAVPRLIAAFALVVAGIVAVIAAGERRRRDLRRRRLAYALLAAAAGVGLIGQAFGYVLTASSSIGFQSWVKHVPVLLAFPLLAVGLVLLAWPPRMTRLNVLGVLGDGLVAAISLAVVWILVVQPTVDHQDGAVSGALALVDVWLQYLLLLAVVVIASASRRTGALPIRQLITLQCSVLVFLSAQIAAGLFVVTPGPAIDWALPGYVAAVAVFVIFALSPALEPEHPSSAWQRDLWSATLPSLAFALSLVTLLWTSVLVDPTPTPIIVLVTGALVLLGVINLVLRLLVADDVGGARLRRLSAGLRDGQQGDWFNALLWDSSDLISVVDRDGVIVYQTPSVVAILGYDQWDLVGRPFADLLLVGARSDVARLLLRASHDDADRGPHELILLDATGGQHDTETLVTPLTAGGADGFVLTSRDVTDRRRLDAALASSGVRDQLTGLTNRSGFVTRLRQELLGATRDSLAVALFDLDGFRDLNDGRGHDAGDEVLRSVAAALDRLPESVRVVGRIGGDEFGLVVCRTAVEPEVGAIERELRESLGTVLLADGSQFEVQYALGYAIHDGSEVTASELLERADLAMVAARTAQRRTVVRFQPTMRATLAKRLRMEADLRDALEENRLVVCYQPIVTLTDGRLESVEALARIQGQDGQLIPPSEFIPRAEDLGVIDRIGQRVLSIALQDAATLAEVMGRPIPVAVNVSSKQLDGSLAGEIAAILAATATSPQQLVVELTESVLAENQEALSRQMAELRGMGCAVALDDFGTGYSSLSYLVGLPVDLLKIDRLFVGNLGSSPQSFAVVRTLLQLAQTLELTAVAEGVESIEQADILRGMSCQRAQGYLYAPPMTIEDLSLLLRICDGVLPAAPR